MEEKRILKIDKVIFTFVCMIVLASCSEHEHYCTFSYLSNFSHDTITYKLTIKPESNWRNYTYSNEEKELRYSIIRNELTDSLFYLENGIKSKTIFLGSKSFDSGNNEEIIRCYLVDNSDLLGENLTIFFSKELGIVINKYTSAMSDLIKIDSDSIEIQKLVRLVKNDSTFINLDKDYFDRHSPKKYELMKEQIKTSW
ncbi:MAG: hypothetical protein AB2L20_16290 [Mangrovibacterium sp.]